MKPFLIVTVAALGVTTCACSGSSPAAQPTHTVTVTARPPASRVSAPTPSPTSNTPVADCPTRDLTGTVGSPQGYAGGLQLAIVFQNLGSAPCSLSGYPGVAQAAGTPITTIGQPSTENPATPRQLVTLPSGGFASAMLRIANSANYPADTCKPVKATWLAVIPPNEKTAVNISFGSTACAGNVKLLSVTTVHQGSAGLAAGPATHPLTAVRLTVPLNRRISLVAAGATKARLLSFSGWGLYFIGSVRGGRPRGGRSE